MKIKNKYTQPILLLGLILISNWFMSSENRVEELYSRGIYSFISKILRVSFGWVPISIGDLLYFAFIALMVILLIKFVRNAFTSPNKIQFYKKSFFKTIVFLGWFWIVFHILWGFNYYRTGIAEQFGLKEKKPTKQELIKLASFLLEETNKYVVGRKTLPYEKSRQLQSIKKAYDSLETKFQFLAYQSPSFKSSLFGILGNYMGYGGYYNPFSGEAQVNNKMPVFVLPFTSAHEVAHQLGYAKESEANFIGYLAAMHSTDSSLRYFANLDIFLYVHGAIRRMDRVAAKKMIQGLSPMVKKDLESYDRFVKKYQGPVDNLTTLFYSRFLKFNNQPEGMRSYSRVVIWVFNFLYS